MFERGVPLLALALASAACARLRLPSQTEERLRTAFTEAVAELDAADREYRTAIETTLPHSEAHMLLSAMASFREMAHQVREGTTREMREIYARYGRSWDWVDPLDASLALPHGFSHADATRLAAIGDRGRAQVDRLRSQANASVADALTTEQTGTLRAARLHRREAFERIVADALRRAIPPDRTPAPEEVTKESERLAQLADGWY